MSFGFFDSNLPVYSEIFRMCLWSTVLYKQGTRVMLFYFVRLKSYQHAASSVGLCSWTVYMLVVILFMQVASLLCSVVSTTIFIKTLNFMSSGAQCKHLSFRGI